MTIESKFVSSKIQIEDFLANIRLIDCVGYVIDAVNGYEDEIFHLVFLKFINTSILKFIKK